MKIQIRNGVFETNSSSMHSIAVRKEHHMFSPKKEESMRDILVSDGKMTIYGEFSFEAGPFEILYTTCDKIRYAIANNADDVQGFIDNELFPILKKYFPDIEEVSLMDAGWGIDVDHQSSELLQNFLEDEGISLEQFLIDSAYVVIIDGDEYDYLDRYLREGFIHKEDFERFYTI